MKVRNIQARSLLFKSARVVSGDGRIFGAADVLIRGGLIHEICEKGLHVPDATVIDGSGKTLIPGMIDAHVHLDFLSVRSTLRSWFQTRVVLPRALSELVQNGVTTIRSMADPLAPILRLRRRGRLGHFTSPAILTSGPAVTAPGGHPAATLAKENRWLRNRIALTPHRPEQARALVGELHAAGVDLIKLVYQGGLYGPERINLRKLASEVAQVIIDEAHKLGLPVSAHTHYQDDVDALLEMGIDSIEHGVLEQELTDMQMVTRWAASEKALVPTLTISALFPGLDDELYIDTASTNLSRAHEGGVKIVAGTDSMIGALPANALHDELQRMVEAGLSESDAIRTATANAADLLGLQDRGVIEPGRRADLVLLGSDPLEQIENISDVRLVVQDGVIVHEAPEPTSPPALDDYHVAGPLVLEFHDRTTAVVRDQAIVQYDRSRFASEGLRTVSYIQRNTGIRLRTETVRSGQDLMTREWWCDIPADQTRLHATTDGHRIALTGSLSGRPVTRSYPLRGSAWMQLLIFDAATFVTSDEVRLDFVAIGASGRGALQLTDFELTKKKSGTNTEAELVMPRWRRFWGATTYFDTQSGDLLRQQIRGKRTHALERTESA